VQQEELEQRELVSPEAFRVPGVAARDAPPAEVERSELESLMAERRARRQVNPDEIAERRPRRASRSAPALEPAEPRARRRLLVSFRDEQAAGTGIAAGTVLRGALRGTAVVGSGQGTAVMAVAGGPWTGSLLIGSASAAGEEARVTIRFHRMVAPDGQEHRIEAEAQSIGGDFGLAAQVMGGEEDDGEIEDAVASSRTARQLTAGLLGGGLVGAAVDDAVDVRRRRRTSGRRRAQLLVPSGTELAAFFHRGVQAAGQ
jgi:hypothetical protein